MIVSHSQQTIVAQCTPIGNGALALLRVSGGRAVQIVSEISILASGGSLPDVPSHTIHYGKIVDLQKELIDQVLLFVMHGPKTFTGEDTVEISCHNNIFIIEAIIAQVIAHGGRLAQNGEFTQRAVLNNKIDLLQAEAIQEILAANTQQALKNSLAQLNGSFSQIMRSIEDSLLHTLALSEASFEFLDEEYLEFSAQIKDRITQVGNTIRDLKNQFNQQLQIRQGFKIAIIGSVNTGKSSLFNRLIGSSRAIVSATPGTTRDCIEAGLYKKGAYWTLTDTAGLRSTDDLIEQEGISRSFEQAHLADLIILTFENSRPLSDQEQAVYGLLLEKYPTKIIPVLTKIDLPQACILPVLVQSPIPVSSAKNQGFEKLEESIIKKLDILCKQSDTPFLLNKRHYTALLELEGELDRIEPLLLSPQVPFELISLHLGQAIANIAQLTGKSISESAMDAVFKTFCVGK